VGPPCQPPYLFPSRLFPPPHRRELAPPRPRVRLMGRPAARPARTPSRNAHAHQGNLPGGERLLWPSSHAARGVVGQRRAATSPPQPARPIPLRRALLPLRRLDREAYTPRPGLCWALTYPHWGFAPFHCSPPQGKKRRGSGGQGRRSGGARPCP
jgi:hypothetical protein